MTILSYDKENEELECLLEFSNRNSVTFKFDTEGDKPDEIAESLVCMIKKISDKVEVHIAKHQTEGQAEVWTSLWLVHTSACPSV